MSDPFHKFFLLPDEVTTGVLSLFKYEGLRSLDKALNNRAMHAAFGKLLCGFHLASFALIGYGDPKTHWSDIAWLATKQVHLGKLNIISNPSEAALSQFPAHRLCVHHVLVSQSYRASNAGLMGFVTTLQGLRTITMHVGNNLLNGELWASTLGAHPTLQGIHLHLRGSSQPTQAKPYVLAFTADCRLLRGLHIECPSIDDDFVVTLAERCPLLETLDLHRCNELTDRALLAVGQHCTKLQYVYIDALEEHLTDASVVWVLQRCRKLTYFGRRDWSKVTDRSIVALAAAVPNMTNLALRRCRAFGSIEAELALQQFCNLACLDLSWCHNISERALLALVMNNPTLRYIHLDEVETVTDAVVAAVAASCRNVSLLHMSCCTQVTDVMPLSKCALLDSLAIDGCKASTDEMMLQLAATPGIRMNVCVRNCDVSAAAAEVINAGARMYLNLMWEDDW